MTKHSTMLGEAGFQRIEGDRYFTEPWVTRALLSRVKFYDPIWEPACGRGDMADVLTEARLRCHDQRYRG